MENDQVAVGMEQLNSPRAQSSKEIITLVVFLVIEIVIMVHFANRSYDRGSWEGLYLLLAFPVYFVIGLVQTIFVVRMFRKHKNVFIKWTMLILGLVFLTVIPAIHLTQQLQNLIYAKENAAREERSQRELLELKQYALDTYTYSLEGKALEIIDVQNDYILVTFEETGYSNNAWVPIERKAILKITNANQIGLITDPKRFIGNKIEVSVDKDAYAKLDPLDTQYHESEDGAAMLRRTYSDLFASRPEADIHDIYVLSEVGITDIPVIIHN